MTAPRLSLEVGRSELDKISGEPDREIETLLAYWDCWSQMEDESLGTNGMRQQSEDSENSPIWEQDSSKPYKLCHQSTTVRYAQEKDEDGGGFDADGSASNKGCDSEEETEEMEADARPLQNALQRENPPRAPQCYPCPNCGQKFSNSSNMRKHLRIHKEELPYGCHICGKASLDPSNLVKHQLYHRGERHHQCSQGPKAFHSKGELDAHLHRHQGTHPFSCLHCEKSYFSQVELANHINVHAVAQGGCHPPGRLRCKDCDRACANKRGLHLHQLANPRFVCKVCGEPFMHKFAYRFHKAFHKHCCKHCGVSGFHICQGAPRAKSGDVPPAGSCTQPDAGPSPKVSARPRPTALVLGQPLSQATVAFPAISAPQFVPVSVVNTGPELLPITFPLSGLGSAKPVAGSLARPPRPTALVLGQPLSQAMVAFPAISLPQLVPVPLVNSGPEMVTVSGLGSALSSNMSPANGAANKNLILLNMETLPPGTKVMLQILGQNEGDSSNS